MCQVVGSCGPDNRETLMEIGFSVGLGVTETVEVCHDLAGARTLWAKHVLWDEVSARDHGNDRPSWDQDFFDFDVDFYYTRVRRGGGDWLKV